MTVIDRDCFATLEFELDWNSEFASHKERYLAKKVNIWRDVFPPGMEERLIGLEPGGVASMDYTPGDAVPKHRENSILNLHQERFRPERKAQADFNPGLGRFYPKGVLTRLTGIYPSNYFPFRVIEVNPEGFLADLNNPLAWYTFRVSVYVHNVAIKDSDVGGSCSVWLQDIANLGPGMQVRYPGIETDFQLKEPLGRPNEENDGNFYSRPRMVGHIDSQASENLQREYAERLSPGMKVLDLMSSLQSHVPLDLDMQVTGLGMNEQELRANPALSDYVLHDLNMNPEIPFDTGSFDAVVCSLSLEYLIRPQMVVSEIRRVLKSGGVVLIGLSNRWFPPKVIDIWPYLYEYERMGLVQELLLRDSGFTGLETVTYRNWWRPQGDRWYGQLRVSDPVYIVGAKVK